LLEVLPGWLTLKFAQASSEPAAVTASKRSFIARTGLPASSKILMYVSRLEADTVGNTLSSPNKAAGTLKQEA